MPLEPEDGAKVIQLITSRYDQREWRKKIEKTLSLPPSGIKDEEQRKIFLFFKIGLQSTWIASTWLSFARLIMTDELAATSLQLCPRLKWVEFAWVFNFDFAVKPFGHGDSIWSLTGHCLKARSA